MLPHHQPDRVRIAFDDHRLVANAGLILPSTPVYPGVGGEPTPDDIGPGQVSRPVVRPGPARHVPSRALDSGGAQHTPNAPGSVLSNHTNRNYARAWTAFSRWCGNRGIPALPARPGDIVMYLDKMAGRGRRVTTVRAARSAISHGHRTAGYADPTADACVKAFLSGLAESDPRPPHQAKPLTEAVMAEILAAALMPRRTSGCAPRLESMLDPERLAQPLPGAIYLASPYTAQDPGVEQARVQAVKHVSGRLIREGQVIFSPLEYTEAMQQRGIVPPQGWYLFDLAVLRSCVKLLVLALPRLAGEPRGDYGDRRSQSARHPCGGPDRRGCGAAPRLGAATGWENLMVERNPTRRSTTRC